MNHIMEDDTFYTITMARVHEGQGNYRRAGKIYRYLLDKNPDDQTSLNALAGIEKRISLEEKDQIVSIVGQWIDLLLRYKNRQQLSKLLKKVK